MHSLLENGQFALFLTLLALAGVILPGTSYDREETATNLEHPVAQFGHIWAVSSRNRVGSLMKNVKDGMGMERMVSHTVGYIKDKSFPY